jgi:integrase
MRPLTSEESRRFLQAARGNRLEALYVLAVTTGMRQGELLALRWQDVDIENGTVSIRRTLTRNGGSIEMGILGDRYEDQGLLFATSTSGPINPSNLRQKSFARLLKEARLPHIRFHDLRYTCATLLLAQGTHPKYV